MPIRAATEADLDPIAASLPGLVAAMNAVGNDQWGAHYPLRSDFAQDWAEGSLFVDEQDGRIRGFAALNLVEPLEYEVQPWTARGLALVVHRLAVTTEFQRRGVAGGLLAFAEARARERGLASLRSDTSELNPGMKAAFVRQGWVRVGPLRFSDATVEFGAWEKLVGRTAD